MFGGLCSVEEAAYIEDYLTRKYEGVAVYPPAGSDGGGKFFCIRY